MKIANLKKIHSKENDFSIVTATTATLRWTVTAAVLRVSAVFLHLDLHKQMLLNGIFVLVNSIGLNWRTPRSHSSWICWSPHNRHDADLFCNWFFLSSRDCDCNRDAVAAALPSFLTVPANVDLNCTCAYWTCFCWVGSRANVKAVLDAIKTVLWAQILDNTTWMHLCSGSSSTLNSWCWWCGDRNFFLCLLYWWVLQFKDDLRTQWSIQEKTIEMFLLTFNCSRRSVYSEESVSTNLPSSCGGEGRDRGV